MRLAQLGQPPVREGHLCAVRQLVDEEEITDEQRAFHAAAGDLERLDKERAQKEEQQHRNSENLRPLP